MSGVMACPGDPVHPRAMDNEMLRRWWQEHSELDELVEAIRMTLGRGALSAATVFLGRLSTLLEGHFASEEAVYFTLIERTAPESRSTLDAAREGHRQLRSSLEDLHVLVENADTASAQRALARLLHKLHVHETHETALIAELERIAGRAGSLA
jgi:hypothetical protein